MDRRDFIKGSLATAAILCVGGRQLYQMGESTEEVMILDKDRVLLHVGQSNSHRWRTSAEPLMGSDYSFSEYYP